MPCDDPGARWAASGAAALSGDPDGPALVPPEGVIGRIEELGAWLGVDTLPLLTERAAMSGFRRRGTTSCGGATRLVPAADGWIAVSLARPEDAELVPAWLQLDAPPDDPWQAISEIAVRSSGSELVSRGRTLGLPVSATGEVTSTSGIVATGYGDAPALQRAPLVVDLSSLWAGPLCTRLLAAHGADVVKVEASGRPDGARAGSVPFFDVVNAGKRCVAIDFTDHRDVERLQRLLGAADLVVEGSRPWALRQLGIDAEEVVRTGPQVWVSITGHGRVGKQAEAVAFGDDAAVAGGLVAWAADGTPRFALDAVADPLTGITVAGEVLARLAAGGRWLLDVAMSRVAAAAVGADAGTPWLPVAEGVAPLPATPDPAPAAHPLGADTDAVFASLGIG